MLLKKIKDDLKKSLKEKNQLAASTLRLLISSIKNKEIELNKRDKLSEEEIVGVIRKEVKKRQESIEIYQKADRTDLADKESQEAKILGKYLPQQMDPSQLEKVVEKVIEETSAAGPKDFGKVMGMVMEKVKGQADGSAVAKMVKSKLT